MTLRDFASAAGVWSGVGFLFGGVVALALGNPPHAVACGVVALGCFKFAELVT